jgi:ribosomal protein S18 acetylase RimI-like enzyme
VLQEYIKYQDLEHILGEKFLFEKFEHRESVFFVAQEQNEIVGFAQLYPIFSSLSLNRVWLLNDFFIAENYRQLGIGKLLLQEVKTFTSLTKAKGIELTVEHSNISAWTFWEKQGFQMDNEFRTYFYKI